MIQNPQAPVMTEAVHHPITKAFYEVGGEPTAQAEANRDSWENILQFFSRFSKAKASLK